MGKIATKYFLRVNNSHGSVYYFEKQIFLVSGRPTKRQQEKMRQNIIQWYVARLSPRQIIQKTKYSKNTVYNCLKEFQKEQKSDLAFRKNLSQIIDHATLAFDQRLEKNLQIESDLEKLSKRYPRPQLKLLSARGKISKQITDLLDIKFSFATKVGMDELVAGDSQ